MIILLGATGYIGQAFAQALRRQNREFVAVSRKDLDYTRFDRLLPFLRERKPEFLINAAGYTGKPNVDACEVARADTLQGNTLFPLTLAHACLAANIPWGHVSSGCIYAGAKLDEPAGTRVEKDLTQPDAKALLSQHPEKLHGFTENDPPNFSFRDGPCSFYSGTKALAEESIAGLGQSYVWRLRIPFDEFDNPRNYLSKIQRYSKVYDNVNSLSHRTDFVTACIETWVRRVPFGTYNVTNPGFVTTRQVVGLIEKILKPNRTFEFWSSDAEFYKTGAVTPRSNCVLDITKLLATGIKPRPVEEALESSLHQWQLEKA
ncbi:MAG: NAD-dependent epimerase/dehydratase family protein [Pedosphaera sp.]|nr:NAD-dependent epimerase/dehydratase family protein [Pedosphaera sp.]